MPYCQKLYIQHCHFLYILSLLITRGDILDKKQKYSLRILTNKLFLQLMHYCYRKCCIVVTKNAALLITV